MRAIMILALLLPACSRQPSFDERYSAAEKRLQAKADELERAAGSKREPATPSAQDRPPAP